jgi:predicted deacylase
MPTTTLKHVQATFTDETAYEVPYWHVDSGDPGPCVLVTAALHGMELQGPEAIRLLLPTVSEQLLNGSCLLVPFANPEAVRRHQHHIDLGCKDGDHTTPLDCIISVNSAWPGRPDGSNAERLADALFRAVVEPATHLIDIHCWQYVRAATGLAREGNQPSIDLVEAAGLPFGRRGKWKPEITERPVTPCTISSYFHDTDRVGMCVELSGQYSLWPDQVSLGAPMLRNSFRHFGMLPGDREEPEHPTVWLNDCEETDIAAPVDGLFVAADLVPGDWVDGGVPIGHIFNTQTLAITELHAPASGYLFRLGPTHSDHCQHRLAFRHPHVEEGDIVATVAVLDA